MIPAVIERCAGIDVGKTFLTVCLLTGPADGEPKAETRKFGTFHADLQALCRWRPMNSARAWLWRARVAIGNQSSTSSKTL